MKTTQEVANALVNYCRKQEFETAVKELYDEYIVSIEPEGIEKRETIGLAAVIQKGDQFDNMISIFHGIEVSDPIVAENFFTCSMKMDATFKGEKRSQMDEICVYQVKDGKIIREEFFYTPNIPK